MIIALFLLGHTLNAQVIWHENFDTLANGTTVDNGYTQWYTDDQGDPPSDYFYVLDNAFKGTNLDSEQIWISESIDISGYSTVSISIDIISDISGFEDEQSDRIKGTYQVDGGSEVTFFMEQGPFQNDTKRAVITTGSSVIIRVYMNNTAADERHAFDNVIVESYAEADYYARADGAWSTGTTWSYSPTGEPTCNCVPDFKANVHVGNNHKVLFDGNAEVVSLTVYNGSELEWNSNSTLSISSGDLEVQSGGTIDRSTFTADVRFVKDYGSNVLTNNGSFDISTLIFSNSNGEVDIQGDNDITANSGIIFEEQSITVTNNSNGTLTAPGGNDLIFDDDSCELINNGTIRCEDILIQDNENDEDNKITNNSGGVINLIDDLRPNDCNFVLDNYGTFNMGGDFQGGDYEPGEVQIYNRADANINWSGSAYDADLELYTDFSNSTFTYELAGGQNIIPPEDDAYYNLTLAVSGIKYSQSDLEINGDLSIEGIARLDVGTNSDDINLAGDWIVTSTNGDPFLEGNENVILDGSAPQTLSSVLAGGETFYNLQINNAGNGLSLSSTDVSVTNTLTLSSGNITTGSSTITLTSSDTADLVHISGHVIGKLSRNINNAYAGLDYEFPVGTSDNENTATFNFVSVPTGGYLTIEFIANDPGDGGLDLSESGLTITDQYTDGYWNATRTALSVGNYDLDLLANGFESFSFGSSIRILKRDNGGNWSLDGTHSDATDPPPAAHRTGLSTGIFNPSSQYGLGHTNCLSFDTQPVSQSVCAGEDVDFTVAITTIGGPETYQWRKNGVNIVGATDDTLSLASVDLSDAGAYNCYVNTSCGDGTSQTATLSIVEPLSGLGYAYSKTITIDAGKVFGNEDLINLPVLVSLLDPDLATESNGGYVKHSSGFDIVFADNQGYKLDHEIEKYTETTGELIAWVRIPVLSYDTDTEFEIIYGNPQISTDPSTTSTWSGDYAGVWHLGDLSDATAYGNDGSGSTTASISGLIGDAQEFDSNTDSIPVTTSGWTISNGFLSAWVLSDGVSGTDYIFGHTDAPDWEDRIQLYVGADDQMLNLGLGDNPNGHDRDLNIYNLTAGSWHHVALNWDTDLDYEVFVNGVSRTSGSYTGMADLFTVADIGNTGNYSYRTEGWDGSIDEVRISTDTRTSGWIATEFQNQVNPSGFYSVSAQSTYSEYNFDVCDKDIITYNVPDLYDTYDWTVGDGGNILSGSGTNEISVRWDGAGATDEISLTVYKGGTCSGSSPTYSLTVNPSPSPLISGNDVVCPTASGEVYTTTDEGHNYTWLISGGTITGGGDTYQATVDWGAGPNGQLVVYDTVAASGCSATDTIDVSIAHPVAPVIERSPDINTVCVGRTLTINVVSPGSGGTGTCIDEYRYSTDDGATWPGGWSTSVPNFSAVIGTTKIQSRRDCDGSGCSSNTNEVSWVVVAQPTAPVMTRTPTPATVCDGQDVSASVTTPGSGGDGCGSTYEYRYDGTDPWIAYAPGNNISTTGHTLVEVHAIWGGCTANAGCNADTNTYSWVVNPNPVATATPDNDTICSGDVTHIVLTSDVPNTAFTLELVYTGVISGASTTIDGDTIKQTLSNSTDIADSVVYRIIPTGPGSSACPGIIDTAWIWVEPTPEVVAIPASDTICNGDNVSIALESDSRPTKPVRFRYTYTEPYGVTVTPGGATVGLVRGDTITDNITNTSDTAKLVTYVITPYTTRPQDDQEKCTGINDTVLIWIEPTPEVVATPVVDTICDGGTTSIALESDSRPTKPVRFRYTYTEPYGITVTPGGATVGLIRGDTITDNIVNTSDTAKLVRYVITPYTTKAHNDDEKCTGVNDTAWVWVEPTPRVIITPQIDTLCNDFFTSITVQIPTVSTNEVKYRFEVEMPEGVYVDPLPDYDLNSGSVIIDSISNTTLSVQQVLFIISPYTWDANDIERCPGIIDTAVIWINPTPVINVALPTPGDTLYCNGSDVVFSVGTDNGDIIGEKVYDITAVYNVVDVSGVTELSAVPNDNTGFTNTLINSHDSIVQKVTYTITPRFINVASDIFECTRGIDTTISVYVAATLNDTLLSAKVWIGGDDLRCNFEQPGYSGQDSAGINLYRWGGFGSFLGTGYYYEWAPATGIDPSAKDQSYLSAGTYTVMISDDVGCHIEDTIELTQPQLYIAQIDSISENLCGGGDEAIIHVSVEGGNEGFEYTWTKYEDAGFLSKEQSPTGLTKGIYYLDTYDTNRCFNAIDEISVRDPSRIFVIPHIKKYGYYEVACQGDSNGLIEILYAEGGNGWENWKDNFTFEWRLDTSDLLPYKTGWEIYNLPAANFYLTIYDSINCRNDYSETPYILGEPSQIRFDSVYIRQYGGIYNIQCYDSLNGAIELYDNAGPPERAQREHYYTWSTNDGIVTESTSQDQENLPAGTYYVQVLDQFNCELRDTFTLIKPPQLILSDTSISDYNGYEITCADSATGWIAIHADGGFYHAQDPYAFEWNHLESGSPVAGIDSVYGLVWGQYQLTVTDSLGCYRIDTFRLDEPEQLAATWLATDYNGVDISCYGFSDGEIDTTVVVGGVESYTYYWTRESDGWNTTVLQPATLTADIYTLRVTDTNGCIIFYSDTLVQPNELLIGELNPDDPTCAGAWNGEIIVDTISGGTLPYSILWNTPFSDTTQNVDSLPTGYYTVQVWDVNNCYTADSAEIIAPPPVDGAIDTISLDMYNNRMISCFGANDAVLGLLDPEGGTLPYQFNWYYDTDTINEFSTDSIVHNRPPGLHIVRMIDAQGCEFTAEIIVTQPEILTSQSFVSDARCYNEPSGSIDFHMAGGTPPYRYGWISGQTESLISDLLAGEYYVYVQDTNRCVYDTTLIVGQPDYLQLNALAENPGCPDDFEGYIQLSPSGGTAPYYITWDDGYSGETRTDLGPGLYVAEVTDDHACITRDSIVLVSTAESCLEIPTAFTPNADGYNDRWIIEGMEYYPNATMRIFNRWGELVYDTKNYYDRPWDGRYKGVKVAVDSYHFVISFTNGNSEITGHVTVIK